jgi:hypothetical protein
MSLDAAWTVTPRETFWFIEAAGWREQNLHDRAVMTAWLTEMFARQKELRPLDRILGRRRKDEVFDMTPDQEALVFEMWAKQHNARLEKGN